jgi:hypothetical protein
MISLIKFIIWTAGALVVAYFVLNYFGYEVNKDYFSDSRKACQERLKECTEKVIRQGIDNAECDFQCVDPKLIIKKKQ